MTLTLTPEVEELINGMVAAGQYSSPEEAVLHGIDLLLHRRLPNSFSTPEELNALIEEGVRSAEQEPALSTSEVRALLSERFSVTL